MNEYIFIDTETTGCRPTIDRIIDIGFYHVINNEIVMEWNRLINPDTYIPGNIQSLTGIDNSMVADAPFFSDIAEELISLINGKILVAHNARFDYAFLRNELKRAGIYYQAKTLCTVKLSRILFPHERSHNLDAIAARFNLTISARHRALGDAHLLVQFFDQLRSQISSDILGEFIKKSLKEHSLPAHISKELIQSLPNTAGVYRFFGDNGALLYVGKSTAIRERVISHFSGDHTSNKEMQLSQQTKSIDYIATAGELGALLKEAHLIKTTDPIFNRQLRRHQSLFTWQLETQPNYYHQLKVIPCDDLTPSSIENNYGLFRRKKLAEESLRELAQNHTLCPKLLGLEKAKGACFNYQIKKCKGACAGKEPIEIYNLRLEMAIAGLRYKNWPYKGKIAIKEVCPETDRQDFHIIDQWCYLGTVNSVTDLDEEKSSKQDHIFDLDIYKLLVKFLLGKSKDIELINLSH